MLALSSWTWLAAAGMAVLALGVLIRVGLGLLGRLKELNGSLHAASGELNEAVDAMRTDLDRMSEGLEALRREHDESAGWTAPATSGNVPGKRPD